MRRRRLSRAGCSELPTSRTSKDIYVPGGEVDFGRRPRRLMPAASGLRGGRRELDAVGGLDRAGQDRGADVEAIELVARQRARPRDVVSRLDAEERARDADNG